MKTGLLRKSDMTKQAILDAAFGEIKKTGFRATSLDHILEKTAVTKGALYHHFPTKKDLGYALIEHILKPEMKRKWVDPFLVDQNPIDLFLVRFNDKDVMKEVVELGCPLNNLAQEMSGLDESFRQKTNEVFEMWYQGLGQAFREGQRKGYVRRDINPYQSAVFFGGSLRRVYWSHQKFSRRADFPKLQRGIGFLFGITQTKLPEKGRLNFFIELRS